MKNVLKWIRIIPVQLYEYILKYAEILVSKV